MKISRIAVFQLDIPLGKPERHPSRTDSLQRVERESRT